MNLQVFVASLAGTGVEFLETAVIASALVRTGSVGEAILGTVFGNLLIALPAYFSWPWLARIPIYLFQCVVGVLLLWLGGSWLTSPFVGSGISNGRDGSTILCGGFQAAANRVERGSTSSRPWS